MTKMLKQRENTSKSKLEEILKGLDEIKESYKKCGLIQEKLSMLGRRREAGRKRAAGSAYQSDFENYVDYVSKMEAPEEKVKGLYKAKQAWNREQDRLNKGYSVGSYLDRTTSNKGYSEEPKKRLDHSKEPIKSSANYHNLVHGNRLAMRGDAVCGAEKMKRMDAPLTPLPPRKYTDYDDNNVPTGKDKVVIDDKIMLRKMKSRFKKYLGTDYDDFTVWKTNHKKQA